MKKKLITLILITLMALFITACGSSNSDEPEQTETQIDAELFKVDEKLIVNFYEACESIGISEDTINLYSVEKSDDGTAFYFDFIWEVYEFDAVADADCNITDIVSGTFVCLQNGIVVSDVSSFATIHQRTILKNQSEYDVKNNLITPATAEFPGHTLHDHEWNIYSEGNTFTVSSWVDAQNEYGALLRYNFTATYDWDGTDETDPVLIDVVISQ